MTEKVAIVGTGLVGRAWSIAFARGGWQCALWDPAEGAAEAAKATIKELVEDLAGQNLLSGENVGDVLGRMTIAPDLEATLAEAVWMQESAPEDLEVKKELWQRCDPLAPEDAILASSTSAIVPSKFTEGLGRRHRCLVAHPLNPPYLIPATELVPAPWTSSEAMSRAERVMTGIGQAPLVMKKELDGFIMNRMQGALFEEAFRLVADGYCSAEDIDAGLREGLALRWSIIGPFETADLNAPGGVRDYVERYQGLYERIWPSMQRRVDWAGPVIDVVERERRHRLPAEKLVERQRWRDRRLMALAAHKRDANKRFGK